MGAILKGRDPNLGRDVAIKVLREDLRDNGDLVRRFVEEVLGDFEVQAHQTMPPAGFEPATVRTAWGEQAPPKGPPR